MKKKLVCRGSSLRGHDKWVTAIAAPMSNSAQIVTSSLDHSIILWDLIEKSCAYRMVGHTRSVEDVVISSEGDLALSSSKDHELRLWDLTRGTMARQFLDHTEGVYSGDISVDNNLIASASADKTIKLWDTRGTCTRTLFGAHSDLVSCVRFVPNSPSPTIVSGSWDGEVKVWDLNNFKVRLTLDGHVGHVNTVVVSPDGLICVTGGRDGKICVWNLSNGEKIVSLNNNQRSIASLCFKPNTYWLCAATSSGIMIWDIIDVIVNHKEEGCTSLNWKDDTLYCGYINGVVRCWGIE